MSGSDPLNSSITMHATPSSVMEGQTFTATISSSGLPAGTELHWTLSGNGISNDDLSSRLLKGSLQLGAEGSGSFAHTLRNDLSTEGLELLQLDLFADAGHSIRLATTTVAVSDTSTATPQQPSVSLSTTPSSVREGEAFTTLISSSGLPEGTELHWTLSGEGISSDDLISGRLEGSFRIAADGSATLSHSLRNDLSTEGPERLQLDVFADAARFVRLSSGTVAVSDTSITPRKSEPSTETKPGSDPETAFTIPNRIFPARFSGQAIAISELIDFNQFETIPSFNFRNSSAGGHFSYQGQLFQGKELREVTPSQLKDLFYIPRAPQGSSDPSTLQTVSIKALVDTFRPKVGSGKTNKKSPELEQSQSTDTIRIKPDPYSSEALANPAAGSTTKDTISVSLNSEAGSGLWVDADWITHRNWQPAVTFQQTQFNANSDRKGIAIGRIVNIHDPDNDTIQSITLEEHSPNRKTGFFTLNSKRLQGKSLANLTTDDLRSIRYHLGSAGTKNVISIIAEDALGARSSTKKTPLITKQQPSPRLGLENHRFSQDDLGQRIPIRNLLTINPSRIDDASTYNLRLNHKQKRPIGSFESRNRQLKSNQLIGLSLDALNRISLVPANSNAQTDITLESITPDGRVSRRKASWSTASPDRPTLSIRDLSVAAGSAASAVPVASLIQANTDLFEAFAFRSIKGEGQFLYGKKSDRNEPLIVPSQHLDKLRYLPPAAGQSDRIAVRAKQAGDFGKPVFATWKTKAQPGGGGSSRSFPLGINQTWSVGDFLGVANEHSINRFLGLDQTIANASFNPDISLAGLRINTGNNRLKAGLNLNAGYGLGSFTIQGGLNADVTLNRDGLAFDATTFDPEIDLNLPYAYLGLDAVGRVKLSPTMTFWYDAGLFSGETGNLLDSLQTDLNSRQTLLNLDTRTADNQGRTRRFNLGALRASASIPRLDNASRLNRIPQSIARQGNWREGFGDGVAFGISGSSTLLDLELSLGQIASYFGIPTRFGLDFWNESLRTEGNLLDASIGIEAGISYSANVALKANVYAQVEGNDQRFDILSDSLLTPNQYSDTNNDGEISVTIAADPIIAAEASVHLDAEVDASAELLSARLDVNAMGINHHWDVGPLWQGGPYTLGSNRHELVNVADSIALSDLAPGLQRQLASSMTLPLS